MLIIRAPAEFGAAPRFRDFDKKHPKRRDLGGTSRGPLINRKDNGFSELDSREKLFLHLQ